jgi:Putative sugar-binding domain
VDTPDEPVSALRADLGRVAANLLAELLQEDDVVGIAWGRTVNAMTVALSDIKRCTIVQMTGDSPAPRSATMRSNSSAECPKSPVERPTRSMPHSCSTTRPRPNQSAAKPRSPKLSAGTTESISQSFRSALGTHGVSAVRQHHST